MAAVTLHDGVADVVAQEIVDGVVKPGEVLSLAALQSRFSISRTVAREVMRMLESVGLLRSRRRVGLVVQPLSEWDVLDARVITWRLAGHGRDSQLRSLTELRTAVEPVAAAAAARNATPQQRARLRELASALHASADSGDLSVFLSADIEFHSLLLESSGNEFFASLAVVFAVTLADRVEHGQMPSHPRAEALASHMTTAEAITDGQSDAAFDAMVGMLSGLRRELFAD